MYGELNCEKLNPFTFSQKCKKGFKRISATNCKRDCSVKENKIKEENKKNFKKISHECGDYSIKYLNSFETFKTEKECQLEYKHCNNSTNSNGEEIWKGDCDLNYKKVGFMCIPVCLSELNQEQLKNILDHELYCIEEYQETGIPVYDIN